MPKRGKVLHKEDRKNSVGRLLFVILAVIIQIIWFWLFLYYLTESYLWASIFARVFSIVMVLGVFAKRTNASIKMTWIFMIMAFPILGMLLYFLVYGSGFTKTMRKRIEAADAMLFPYLDQSHLISDQLKKENKSGKSVCLSGARRKVSGVSQHGACIL